MIVHQLIEELIEENPDIPIFFIDEQGESKIYNITKIGKIEGINAILLGSGECPYCKGEK